MPLPPFTAFLEREREVVYRVLVGLVGPDEADDCFQETFIKAMRAYPDLPDGGNLRGWILTIARRAAIVPLLGGGFGRKSKPDFVCEAALLSREVGAPVKVQWTRADDLQHDFYHANAAVYVEAALDKAGKPTAWLQRTAFPSISATFESVAAGS